MKGYLAIALGFVLLMAPLWFLSGFAVVPEYRTGTIADFAAPLIAGATLYSGVFGGALVSRRYQPQRYRSAPFRSVFIAGMAGAMVAITLALIISFLSQFISTGRMMPAGQSPALLPVVYIVGGIVSLSIAAGAGLIAYAATPKAGRPRETGQ